MGDSRFNKFQAFLAKHEDSLLFQIGFGFVFGVVFGGMLLLSIIL